MTVVAAAAGGGGDVLFGVSLGMALLMLATLPLALLAAARLRSPLERTGDRLAGTPGASLAVGATAALVTLVLLAGSGRSPFVAVPALLALAALSLFVLLGLTAEARRLGAEIRGREPLPESVEGGSVAIGWLVLAGIPLLPLAGPLVLLYLALRASGASLLTLTNSKPVSHSKTVSDTY